MGWLIGSALRIRFIVVAAAIVLLTVGGNIVRNTSIDVFPEFAPPRVEIQTEVPGLSADQVEALVTVPLESALNGAPWLTTVRSKSVLGLSSVTLFFEDGVDVMQARQVVQERVAIAASELTAVASPPVILSPLSSTSRVLKIGMQSETLNQTELTTLALWTIRPRLMAIPGVANAAVWGQRERQLQVQVDPQRLLRARRHARRSDGERRGGRLRGGRSLHRRAEPASKRHASAGGSHGRRSFEHRRHAS